MERIGKYLKVIEQHVEPPGKTRRWILLNNAEEHLGWIKWYAPWRQYCFFDADSGGPVFNKTCLNDISKFLDRANKEHRAGLQTKRTHEAER